MFVRNRIRRLLCATLTFFARTVGLSTLSAVLADITSAVGILASLLRIRTRTRH